MRIMIIIMKKTQHSHFWCLLWFRVFFIHNSFFPNKKTNRGRPHRRYDLTGFAWAKTRLFWFPWAKKKWSKTHLLWLRSGRRKRQMVNAFEDYYRNPGQVFTIKNFVLLLLRIFFFFFFCWRLGIFDFGQKVLYRDALI